MQQLLTFSLLRPWASLLVLGLCAGAGVTAFSRAESRIARSANSATLVLHPATVSPLPDLGAEPPRVEFRAPAGASSRRAPGARSAAPAQVDPQVVLRAIAEVESHNDASQVGRLGERGLYQFRRATWRQHTRQNFALAHHREISTAVARRHYDWLVQQLQLHGFEGSPYEVALAWNAGVNSVLSGKLHRRTRLYAQRVVNLVGAS